MPDFVTSHGHSENNGLLNNTDLPNVDIFHDIISSKNHT